MSEDELLQILEEFETTSEIKDFFEQNCKNIAIKPFDYSLIKEAKQKVKTIKESYTTDILVKNISGVNNETYHNKTPLYLCNHEDNMNNALKAFINNPESLFENSSKKQLSFILVKDKDDNLHYFLDQKGNHRVTLLIILSDICEKLCLYNVKVKEYIL